MAQKKLSSIAKQICAGMSKTYNAHFDSSELFPLLVDATKQVQKGTPDPQASALLKAVQRFDLKSVMDILSCYDNSPKATPCLSIGVRARQ